MSDRIFIYANWCRSWVKIQQLQRKLYRKAKLESDFRFYALYDKVYRAVETKVNAYERR